MKDMFSVLLLGSGIFGIALIFFKDLRDGLGSIFSVFKTGANTARDIQENLKIPSNPEADKKFGRVHFMYPATSNHISQLLQRVSAGKETPDDITTINNYLKNSQANKTMNIDAQFNELKNNFHIEITGLTRADSDILTTIKSILDKRAATPKTALSSSAVLNTSKWAGFWDKI